MDLEKIRYGNRLRIKSEIADNTSGYLIAPLLLLPFVENSFKHGASNDIESPFIELKADVKDKQLHFQVLNSYRNESGNFRKYKEGIGLQNVRRRLELLYPDKYSLEIKQHQDVFEVYLTLELKPEASKLSNEI
jgi:LytS/YehU family sensor histidine kinase